MKFCAFTAEDGTHIGAWTASGVVDLTALGFASDMDTIIAGGEPLRAWIQSALDAYTGARLREDALVFANVTRPGKIVCAGLNYTDHAAETGGEPPTDPVLFSKFPDALSPAGAPVPLPSWQRCYDYEAELVIVVAKRAYNVPVSSAEAYIFGYTCGNDLSARDAQFLSSQWLAGKTFPGFAPAGPWIVTRDAFDPEAGRGIFCDVNGARVQDGNTANMIFSCKQTLAAASRFFPLDAGDLIFTGTPAGVILGKPKGERVWLKPGDTVAVEIEGIGRLTTPLV